MGMSPDPDRVRLVDFTGPVAVTRYHLLNPYPKEESRLYGPVRPFQLQVSFAVVRGKRPEKGPNSFLGTSLQSSSDNDICVDLVETNRSSNSAMGVQTNRKPAN